MKWRRLRAGEGPAAGLGLVLLLLIGPVARAAEPAWSFHPEPAAPPAAPPVHRGPEAPATPPRLFGATTSLYSIGQPTDEEQLYLEYINRARPNPAAEGQRLKDTTDPDVLSAFAYYNLDTSLMVSQFMTLSATAPLSFNSNLIAAARGHSQDMILNNFQGHSGSDGRNPGQRLTAAGYGWTTYAENVFASAKSVFHGHAAFEADWGQGPGGMQTPPGHRLSIHSSLYREVGLGVCFGTNQNVGPQAITQKFASRAGLTPFLTGVVYYDLNGNGLYDLGEGMGGVTVSVSGASFGALTANSGGYSVPVPGDGVYSVTFSAPNLVSTQVTAFVSGGQNLKVDYVPVYAPPVISGPAAPAAAQSNHYTFSTVGAAIGYEWKQARRVAPAVEGAENGLANVTALTSPGYAVVDGAVKASGNYSFHLAHTQAVAQSLTLNRVFELGAGSQLIFAARLGTATSNQIARAQVSTDYGATWQTVWSRAGTGSPGQTSFIRSTNSLSAWAGQEAMVRFVYDFTSGSYYPQTNAGFGLYVDDITLGNAEELVSPEIRDIPAGTAFLFTPPALGNYSLRVRARLPGRLLPWGPSRPVTAVPAPPVVRLLSGPLLAGSQVIVPFEVVSGTATNFTLERSISPAGAWTVDSGAVIQTNVPGSRYQAVTATGGGAQRCYRIVVW